MTKQTQCDVVRKIEDYETYKRMVKKELIKYGNVTRNWCLARGITRLGGIINDLVNHKWVFHKHGKQQGHYIMIGKKRDFAYDVKSIPKDISK